MKNNISNSMKKASLKKLSKSELIKLLLKQSKDVESNVQENVKRRRPIPTPRRSVKEMVKRYEENIILPPEQFRDNYKTIQASRTRKPVPTPRTIIKQTDKALKGCAKSYEINIRNNRDPLIQMQNTRKGAERQVTTLLNEMKGLKYVETLKVTFEKVYDLGRVEKTAYFNSAAKTIINEMEITDSLQLTKQQILNKIAQWISEGSLWTIKSIDSHYLNIAKYEPMKGSSYIQLPSELRNSKKGLINMKNEDNECFRWCHIRQSYKSTREISSKNKKDRQTIR